MAALYLYCIQASLVLKIGISTVCPMRAANDWVISGEQDGENVEAGARTHRPQFAGAIFSVSLKQPRRLNNVAVAARRERHGPKKRAETANAKRESLGRGTCCPPSATRATRRRGRRMLLLCYRAYVLRSVASPVAR